MWKLYYDKLSQNIRNIFIKHNNKNQSPGSNLISLCRSNYKEGFIANTGPLVWNEPPGFLKKIKILQTFQKNLNPSS